MLTEFTQSESLRKHALSVEACMRAYARKFGDNEDRWGMVGLLHDFDYDQYPSLEDHPYKGNEILKERGYPEDIRRAIMSHADYTGVSRESAMEKALFACDELAGFITATALIKPNKSLAEVDAKSIRKRMKDKAFARSVSREDIINGAAGLNLDLDEHITFCIEAMKGIAEEIGLAGKDSLAQTCSAKVKAARCGGPLHHESSRPDEEPSNVTRSLLGLRGRLRHLLQPLIDAGESLLLASGQPWLSGPTSAPGCRSGCEPVLSGRSAAP